MVGSSISVLLVEDDEDDFVIARDLFAEMPGRRFALDWARSFDAGLQTMVLNQHDVCLVDYRLGARNGVDLLRAAIEGGCQSPIILLTGAGEHEVDIEAMQAGAADYLVKSQLQSNSLERSIRYALQRKRAAALAAFEQARLAAFGAEIGLALTRRDSLKAILDRCAKAMAQYLNAGVAQILSFESKGQDFEALATAGPLMERREFRGKVPDVSLDLASLAEGKPTIIKQLLGDSRVADQELVKREGVISYAAYPLLLEDKLIGLMAIFAQQPLTEQINLEMGSVAHGIALCIERKRSEEALGVSEFKYRSVVESIKEVIFQLDEFGNWTFLNPAWTAVTGFPVKSTLGTFFLEYIGQEDRQQNQEIFLRFIERKLDYCRYETRFITKDGKIRWVEVYGQLSLGAEGQLLGISGSLTDITDRKIAEIQIKKLAAFPRVNPNPVLEFSMDGTLTYSNDAALQMAKSLGHDDLLSILPPNAGVIARETLESGQNRLREEVNINGRTITWSFFPVTSSHVVHCYGVDVTDMLSLEAQLRHAQKLESVGQLAAGVAHDFNNILTVIQGYSDCLLVRVNGDETMRSALKQICDASKRAASLTRQLLVFSRKQVIQPKVLDLNTVLQNLSNMLPRLLGEDVVLQTNYAPNLPRIEADTGMLEQVVMNLAVNARDAMPKGGTLSLRTTAVDIGQDYASRHPDSRAGTFACLTVTDTGCGMDAKTLERIFEPFFTTKEAGKGTGLGLATVFGIVQQHGGWIDVQSHEGEGSSFAIYLPAQTNPVVARGNDWLPRPQTNGRETILLAEDNEQLRLVTARILRQAGYKVLEAFDGKAAKQVIEQNSNIDLFISDVVMPGMMGDEIANQLLRQGRTRVILMSAYNTSVDPAALAAVGGAYLSKPFNTDRLLEIVRTTLDQKAPEPVPA